MDIVVVDTDDLKAKARSFAARMYGDDDPRKELCAQTFFHEEYIRMTRPPSQSTAERIEVLLVEIRDLLKSK